MLKNLDPHFEREETKCDRVVCTGYHHVMYFHFQIAIRCSLPTTYKMSASIYTRYHKHNRYLNILGVILGVVVRIAVAMMTGYGGRNYLSTTVLAPASITILVKSADTFRCAVSLAVISI